MGMQSLERRLERMVEGVFSRRASNTIRPIELGRRLVREMDDQRSVDVKGRRIVPNDFTIHLAARGPRRVRRHRGRAPHRAGRGRPRVRPRGGLPLHGPGQRRRCGSTNSLKPGRFGIASQLRAGRRVARRSARSCCRRASGSSSRDKPLTIGRLSDCDRHPHRPQRQPPPRRDPPRRQRLRGRRPRLHQRHDGQRRPDLRASTGSTTATSSASDRPTSGSRRPDPPVRHPP